VARAFTLLELILGLTILGILAAAVVPTTQKIVKREKELELKRALMEMRHAIDSYKKAADEGIIDRGDMEAQGYPTDFEDLMLGVPLKKDSRKKLRFLRKVPVDPVTGEANWGKRSSFDDPESNSWGHENLFDVYSKSDGIALDGSEYATW
jgi:general secretion pathway protein G